MAGVDHLAGRPTGDWLVERGVSLGTSPQRGRTVPRDMTRYLVVGFFPPCGMLILREEGFILNVTHGLSQIDDVLFWTRLLVRSGEGPIM